MGLQLGFCPLVVYACALGCGGASTKAARAGKKQGNQDQPSRWVRNFTLEGNWTFSDSDILAVLHYGSKSDGNRLYDPAELERDEKRIVAFYRDRGYFSTQARAFRVIESDGAIDIAIEVKEGYATRVASIRLGGNFEVSGGCEAWPGHLTAGPRSSLQAAGLREGAVFVHEQYVAAKDRLLADLETSGHIYARVTGEVQIDRERRAARVELCIRPGPRVHFGETKIRGNQRIPEATIRARVAWERGEVFSEAKLLETRKALFELGQFSSVHLAYDREECRQETTNPGVDCSTADIAIELREGKRRDLRLGGGVGVESAGGTLDGGLVESTDTRLELRGRAELTLYSFVEPLLTLHLGIRPGYVALRGVGEAQRFIFEGRAAIERPDFLWSRLTLGAHVTYSRETFEAYSSAGPKAGIHVERRFWGNSALVRLGAGGSFLRMSAAGDLDLDDLATDDPLGVAFLEQSVAFDRRDDHLSPTSGWYAEQRLEEGLSTATNHGRYFKSVTDLRGYLPLGGRVVVAGRVRAGFLATASGRDSPITQRFFSGGSTSQRGFRRRLLSPVVQLLPGRSTFPIGGNALFESSVDFRIRLVNWTDSWLGGVIFIDAGDTTESVEALDPENLHIAFGLGLRYKSPLLPIRIDIAQRVTRIDPCPTDIATPCSTLYPDKPLVFHFSVGEAF